MGKNGLELTGDARRDRSMLGQEKIGGGPERS